MLSGVGVNVNFNASWEGQEIWTNVSRIMTGWNYVGDNWRTANPSVQTDALGAPLSDASSFMTLANYPDGVYAVSFKGSATVDFQGVGRLVAPLVKGVDGVSRGQVLVDGTKDVSNGLRALIMNVTAVNPADPLFDLKIIAPGYPADGSRMYTDAFLRDLQPFDDVRFLDWELTTNSSLVHWADRAQPGQVLSTWDHDLPIDFETMIELGNEAHKDIWLNVPAQADDDFVRNLADLVRDKLDPSLKVYIEYSNETWNSYTQAYFDVLAAAQANPLVTATDDVGKVVQQTAFRLKGVSDIFRQQFGAGFDRVVPVFCGWTIYPSVIQVGLGFIQQNYGDPSQYVKATAIGLYMDWTDGANASNQTPTSLIQTMYDYLDQVTPALKGSVQAAAAYGLPLDAYEGGQSLWASVAPQVANAVQDDPRMYALYQHYLSVWKAEGGGLLNLYTLYGGFWGLKYQVSDAGSPKFDAVVSSLVPAGDANLDGKVDYADFQALAANYGQVGKFWRQGDFNQDGRVDSSDVDVLVRNIQAGALTASQAAEIALFSHSSTTADRQAIEFDLFGRSYVGDLNYSVVRGGPVPVDAAYNGTASGAGVATLGGAVFNKNLGVSSDSRIDVPLAGGFTTFNATIGVDDRAGSGAGRSVFQVVGDGRVLYTSPVMSAGAAPIPIEVSVKGVATLSLIVTTSGGGGASTPADWGAARLIDSPSTSSVAATRLAWTVTKDGAPFASSTADSFVFAPAGPGDYVVSVQATDSQGASASRSLAIAASPPLSTNTASYVTKDVTTKGTWTGVYGDSGYSIANHVSSLPAYARVSLSGQYQSDWDDTTTDVRALQYPGGGATDRVASYWAGTQFTIDLNLTDGQAHKVSLYALDWTGWTRSERIEVLDAATGAVLDTQTIASFTQGDYLTWNVSGHVQFRVTATGGYNAVISGLFVEERPAGMFLGRDDLTQGDWKGIYGSNGYSILEIGYQAPGTGSIGVAGQTDFEWTPYSDESRALRKAGPGQTTRLAAAWTGSQFTINVNLTDGLTHRVSLYAVDWDRQNRAQRIDVIDTATGTVLDSQTMASFTQGAYMSWNVNGNVTFRVTCVGGKNAAVSGLFVENGQPLIANPSPPPPVGAPAQGFVGRDAQTQGSWQGSYGAQGYTVLGGGSQAPSGGAISMTGALYNTWTKSTNDVRALQKPGGSTTDRVADCWYGSQFTVNVNLTDGQSHKVSLYFLDWDRNNRSQRIDLINPATGAVLDSQTLSSFENGVYLSWNVSGQVQFRITCVGGTNAVVGGVFIDSAQPSDGTTPPVGTTPPDDFAGRDVQTQGSWQGSYGAQGYTVLGGGSQAPSGGAISMTGALYNTWASSTNDVRALQKPGALTTDRVADCWYGSQFTVNVNLTDGQTHKVSLYFLDWDRNNRSQRIDVIDAATGAVLDSQTLSSFENGVYLSWNVSGQVQFRITCVGGTNAVVGGVFIDAAQQPTGGSPVEEFVGKDVQTRGTWQGTYGSNGYNVLGGGAQGSAISMAGALYNTWTNSTTDLRALQVPGAAPTSRVAACWYGSQFTINVNLTDGQTHKVSLYAVDWDRNSRSQQIDVIDAATGAVLDSQTLSSFENGAYLSWNVSGQVQFRITCVGGTNAVIGGVFID